MESKFDLFRRAVMSGMCIGIGCMVYLACDVKYVGAVLFSLGLYTILTQGYALYTGMVGYFPYNRNLDYLVQLIVVILGNFTGTAIIGIPIHFTRQAVLAEKAVELCTVKLGDSMPSLFILGIGCGMLMYIAVSSYKNNDDSLTKLLGTFLCIPVFILAGMEHSIADMCYFTIAGMWSAKAVLCILVIILGNAVGGMLLPVVSWNIKK